MFSAFRHHLRWVAVLVCIGMFGLIMPVRAGIGSSAVLHAPTATCTVTNTNDAGSGSLRQAVADAADGDTINFDLAYPATITLTSGEIFIGQDITIAGPGADRLTISGNGAQRVFYIGSGGVILTDLTITEGNMASLYGGAIYYGYGGGELTLTRVNVYNNAAMYGGGIYLSSGRLIFNAGEIDGNRASSSGGGIYVASGTVTLNGEKISSNSAPSGGGIFIESGEVALDGGQIISNTASSDGGGVYINQANAAFTMMNDGLLAYNTAFGGGAVYINSGHMTVNGGQISNNAASTSGWGGGVFISSGGDLQLNAGEIVNNTAARGGGITIDSGHVQVDGGQIISNTVTDYGGGVYIRGGWIGEGSVTLAGGQLMANTASYGGGVYVEATNAIFTQTGVSTITHNTAQYGGGLSLVQGHATLEGGQIAGNSATIDGGGIWGGSVDVALADIEIISNTAGGSGGGLYISGNLVMTDTRFLGNTAGFQGGGAWSQNAYLTGGTFQNNVSEFGGGLIVFGEARIADIQFLSNTATAFAGGGMSIIGNGYLTGTSFYYNQCTGSDCRGGGLYLYSGNNAVLANVIFADNYSNGRGGGLCNEVLAATLLSSTLRNNTASYSGGGVYNGARLLVDHSALWDNLAGSDGGGIYNGNELTITNSTLSNNSANVQGGGVYNGNVLAADYSTISRNSANGGGGIYNDSTADLQRSIIAGNAASGSGPEIYNSDTVIAADFNVIGYGGSPRSAGFTPSGTDIVPVGALNTVLNSTLQDNGGPTLTHALVPNSPAIDVVAVDGSICNPPVTTDQRGAVRADGANRGGAACDSGAYEYGSAQTPTAISLQSLTVTGTIGSIGWLVVGCMTILGSILLSRRRHSSIN